MQRSVRVASILALAVVVATACSPEPRPRAPGPASASVVAATPQFVNGERCPEAGDDGLPPRAGCVTAVTAGDETLSVYGLLGRNGLPESWRVRLTTPGGEVERRLPYGTVTAYPRVAAASDLDGDGDADWWWVKVLDYASHGAPWGGVAIFVSDEASLEPVELDGEPFVVNFGGISRLGEGAECRDGSLVVLRVEAKDRANTRWSTSERTYAIEATTARLLDRREGILEIDGYSDPELHRYYRVDCAGAVFTPFGEVEDP